MFHFSSQAALNRFPAWESGLLQKHFRKTGNVVVVLFSILNFGRLSSVATHNHGNFVSFLGCQGYFINTNLMKQKGLQDSSTWMLR